MASTAASSNNEPDSAPLSTLSDMELRRCVDWRLTALVNFVQNPARHTTFAPGKKWFLASSGRTADNDYPDAVHFLRQIGITLEDMERAYSRQWIDEICATGYFRKWHIGRTWFITVEMSSEDSDYGDTSTSPHYLREDGKYKKKLHTVVSAKDNERAVNRLLRDIKSCSEDAKNEYEATVQASGTAKPATSKEAPPPTHAAAPASTVTPTAPATVPAPVPVAEADSVSSIAPSPAPVTSPAAAGETHIHSVAEAASSEAAGMTLEKVYNFAKSLQVQINDAASLKKVKHIAFHLIQILRGPGMSDTVKLTGATGGGSTWRRERDSRGGKSERTHQRDAAETTGVLNRTLRKSGREGRVKTVEQAVARTTNILKYDSRGRKVITLSEDEELQLLLQSGMTGNGMDNFHSLFAEITGHSFHKRENTLTKLTAGLMPSFSVDKVPVVIKGQDVEKPCLTVDSLSDVITARISSLYEAGLLKNASEICLLDDHNIIVRFGGDKGGKFMQFKFGTTVMNGMEPNSADAFDICATLDAPDTYYNLKEAIFNKYNEELKFYFNTSEPPKLIMFGDKNRNVLGSIVYNEKTDGSFDAAWTKKEMVDCAQNAEPSSEKKHSGGPYYLESSSHIQLLVEDNCVWGLRLLNTGRDEGNVIRFKREVPVKDIDNFSPVKYNFHSVLGGDIDFIHICLGLQNCSATCPCYKCEIRKQTLQSRNKSMEEADLRTRENFERQLKAVTEGDPTVAEMKRRAKSNGSVFREPLVPADFSRVLLAPLHIILGIVKKMWDGLLIEIQNVDHKSDESYRDLVDIRDDIALYLEFKKVEEDMEDELYDQAEDRKKKMFEKFCDARMRGGPDDPEVKRYKRAHDIACKAEKEAKEMRKSRDKKSLLACKRILDRLNEYLRKKRGRYERVLEELIGSSPINAKHNPFYGGSFNGNDCFRLVQNYQLIFKALRAASDETIDKNKDAIEEIAARHEKVFEAFNVILPSFRTTRLLKPNERVNLINDIKNFWDAYIDNTKSSVTIKVHHLCHHAKLMIETYGTIGFFAEDGMESIHAVVNTLARQYASLDEKRRAVHIFKARIGKQHQSIKKEEKRVKDGKKPKKKRKRVQGQRAGGQIVIPTSDTHVDKMSREAVQQFKDAQNEAQRKRKRDSVDSDDEDSEDDNDDVPMFPECKLVTCKKCMEGGDDMEVPDVLSTLHDLLYHVESNERLSAK